MNRRLTLAAVSLLITTFSVVGCDKKNNTGSETGTSGPRDTAGAAAPGVGGTGNAGTSIGSGATNGVVGSETRNAVGAPGNTETGAGSTTQPTSGPAK